MNTTQVLIVGAGPTGLAAAAALAKLGVRVRIVEKNVARSTTSKALGVQAGTLACLGAALGLELPRRMIEAGHPARAAFIHVENRKPIRADISTIPSENNFVLILAQSETEKFLEEQLNSLGVKVGRSTQVLSVEDLGDKVCSRLRDAAGNEEEVISDFVLGADGAHSIVRREAEIEFKGDAYSGNFVLGDVEVEWSFPYDVIHVFLSARGSIAAFPMRGERRYRLMLVTKTRATENESPTLELVEFQKILSSLSPDKISARNPTWLTRFRVHHRLAEHFQKGRVFLAGDAAHIHSPAGGQGMNTGIQDALNLAFKIKRVVEGLQPMASLESYERERRPVALDVVRSTDFVFKLALTKENAAIAFVRRHLLPSLASSAFVQRHVVAAISEMAIAKKEIARYSDG